MGTEFRREYQISLINMPHQIVPPTLTSARLESFNFGATSIGNDSRVTITIADFRDCAGEANDTCTELGSGVLVLGPGDSINTLQLLDIPFDLEITGDDEIDPAVLFEESLAL